MQSWGFIFGPEDEIKVRKIMKLLNRTDYEEIKKLYIKNANRDTTK